MKALIFGLFILIANKSFAQNSSVEEEIIQLSKDKWQCMADKNVEALSKLFHDKSMFVHMGGSWEKNVN